MLTQLKKYLQSLYSLDQVEYLEKEIKKLLEKNSTEKKLNKKNFSEKDIFFITYPDTFYSKNQKSTLPVLKKFLDENLQGLIDNIHILPFFPYSSDRGFSIIDYYQVKKEFGSWEDIKKISEKYFLMADLVLNHISTKSQWFKKFLQGNKKYENYFIWFEKNNLPSGEVIKKIKRPRLTPLFTPFKTKTGLKYLWTTFSVENYTDQVDLNYQNPQVILEIIKVLIFLLKQNIKMIRLDAIIYLWKKLGTDCYALPETHIVVKILKLIMKKINPQAVLITEANVDDELNFSFFSKKNDEADLVYNFSLSPLIFYSYFYQDPIYLIKWAKNLSFSKNNIGFFNFLSTHDGIGLNALRKIIADEDFWCFIGDLEKRSFLILKKSEAGKEFPYEINTTWWSAINCFSEEKEEDKLRKFLSSIALILSFKGIPALYYNLFFGLENDMVLYRKTKVKRDVNRSNLDYDHLFDDKKRKIIFSAVTDLIKKRKKIRSFSPQASQRIIEVHPSVFALQRSHKEENVFCFYNFSSSKISFVYNKQKIKLLPYDYYWLIS